MYWSLNPIWHLNRIELNAYPYTRLIWKVLVIIRASPLLHICLASSWKNDNSGLCFSEGSSRITEEKCEDSAENVCVEMASFIEDGEDDLDRNFLNGGYVS